MPKFIPGLRLSELFYHEAVSPILESQFPEIPYSAALLGAGSEVLGYDTSRSTDHHWGPRLQLFLSDDDYKGSADEMRRTLSKSLPHTFRGYSTNFGPPDKVGVRLMRDVDSGPIDHMVEVHTIESFFLSHLGINPLGQIRILDWLVIPQQKLLEVTAGLVFHDGLEKLDNVRRLFHYYPTDVWLYVLAAQWRRIAGQEAFTGRTWEAGDELGSRLIASRQVREMMKLCLLIEKQYAPYDKWLGTAFARLPCAKNLLPIFHRVIRSSSWQEREANLSIAYSMIAKMHNDLGITSPLDTPVSRFYDRPYLVIRSERFAASIQECIKDPEVRSLSRIGSVDQFVDSTEVESDPKLYRKLAVMYQPIGGRGELHD